jgi:hypothetical protein
MRAAYITSFSKTLENLRVESVPDPIVTPGEAKIKIMAASVNPSDVKNVQGKPDTVRKCHLFLQADSLPVYAGIQRDANPLQSINRREWIHRPSTYSAGLRLPSVWPISWRLPNASVGPVASVLLLPGSQHASYGLTTGPRWKWYLSRDGRALAPHWPATRTYLSRKISTSISAMIDSITSSR